MLNFRKFMDAQIQEFVFFSSLILALTVILSGILFTSFEIGNFAVNALFSLMGYAYFYFAVVFLHMGYMTNFHVFSLRDFKRESNLLFSALFAHVVILFLFANFLNVVQISMGFAGGEMLVRGAGGLIGLSLSKALFIQLGAFGSLLALGALMLVTALLGGFFEIPEVVTATPEPTPLRKKAPLTKAQTSSFIAGLQMLARGEEITATHHNSMARTWMGGPLNKAQSFVADQFPVKKEAKIATQLENKKSTNKVVGSLLLKKTTLEVKKVPAKKASVSHFMRRKLSADALAHAQSLLDSFMKKNEAKNKSTNKKKSVKKKLKKK